jgi:hypothetical protein
MAPRLKKEGKFLLFLLDSREPREFTKNSTLSCPAVEHLQGFTTGIRLATKDEGSAHEMEPRWKIRRPSLSETLRSEAQNIIERSIQHCRLLATMTNEKLKCTKH